VSAQTGGDAQQERYDVAILGGGLAGLTLGLQLKKARPDTSILITEKRAGPAPEAAFKVGESTVELSAYYFAKVVGMEDHMENEQNPKLGLRFFFPAEGNRDIARRVEWGSPGWPPVKAYQLDRGRFENELGDRNVKAGNEVLDNCSVQDVDLRDGDHAVTLGRGRGAGEPFTVEARWVVDASGRASLLKRKLGLAKENGHHVNSSWFRLAGGVDLEDWADESNEEWFGRMWERGLRKFSTNHLMGKGYWVWLIPLASGPISIGLVADPRFHPWERMSDYGALVDWFREHEPQLAAELEGRDGDVEDFLKIEDFSYGCEKVFSRDRWALTGESGAFLDPLYSPGSDYIALGNTYITDAVRRDLDGEDVSERIETYNEHYFRFFEASLAYYRDQYHMFGDPQVSCVKLHWDYTYYWSFPALWFYFDKWTDLDWVKENSEEFEKARALQMRMQQLFKQWHALLAGRNFSDWFVPLPPFLRQIHDELGEHLSDDALREKATRDRKLMEAFAVATWAKAARLLPDFDLDLKKPVNPYALSLEPERWEEDGLFDESGISAREARRATKGLQFSWLDEFSGSAGAPAATPSAGDG